MANVASPAIEISTTNPEPRRTGKRGGDRRSERARALQTAKRPLVSEISERRQQLDQALFEHIRDLRRMHGDRAVDQALARLQEQRDAVAVAPRKQERGPRLFGK